MSDPITYMDTDIIIIIIITTIVWAWMHIDE